MKTNYHGRDSNPVGLDPAGASCIGVRIPFRSPIKFKSTPDKAPMMSPQRVMRAGRESCYAFHVPSPRDPDRAPVRMRKKESRTTDEDAKPVLTDFCAIKSSIYLLFASRLLIKCRVEQFQTLDERIWRKNA
jgi:hypothetical protein